MLARIVHVSDIHFGRIRTPEIVQDLVDQVNSLDATVVVISGDITQRARRKQWRQAIDFLSKFNAETLVIPGNHDVYAWWYAHYRLTKPLARYEKYISRNLSPVFENENLRMVGFNSSHGWTIKSGKFSDEDVAAADSFFEHADPAQFKVVVVHHHLMPIEQLGKHDVAIKGNDLLETAAKRNVQLVLCGHLHQSHVEEVNIGDSRIIIASAGTATSDRGRKTNKQANHFNIVDIYRDRFDVQEMVYEDESRVFSKVRTSSFEIGS